MWRSLHLRATTTRREVLCMKSVIIPLSESGCFAEGAYLSSEYGLHRIFNEYCC